MQTGAPRDMRAQAQLPWASTPCWQGDSPGQPPGHPLGSALQDRHSVWIPVSSLYKELPFQRDVRVQEADGGSDGDLE